jgi:hypothetical protein
LTLVAESQAGVGQVSGPIHFRTLDRQPPDFIINDSNENQTCFNDQTCSIVWNILSDGGAPITRVEIAYAPVRINAGDGEYNNGHDHMYVQGSR